MHNLDKKIQILEARIKLLSSILELHQKLLEEQQHINSMLLRSSSLKSTGLRQKKVSKLPGDREFD